MKKRSVMLMILMMVSSTIIFAQRHNADGKARGDRMNEYMKKELSLTDAQYAKVKTINQTFGDRFKQARKDSTATKEASRAQMKKIHDDYTAALKGALTDKQFAQWTALKANHADKRMGDRAERMKKELALNDDQYSKVKAIDKSFGDRFKTLRKDSTLTKETSRTEFKKIRDEKNTAIKGVLTTDQYNKWISMKGKHGDGKHGGDGRHGDRKRKDSSSTPDNSKG